MASRQTADSVSAPNKGDILALENLLEVLEQPGEEIGVLSKRLVHDFRQAEVRAVRRLGRAEDLVGGWVAFSEVAVIRYLGCGLVGFLRDFLKKKIIDIAHVVNEDQAEMDPVHNLHNHGPFFRVSCLQSRR
jgi:hypothetical protein